MRQVFTNILEERFQSGCVVWSKLLNNITQVCKDVCGVTTDRRGQEREKWRWNQAVQLAIGDKKEAFKT